MTTTHESESQPADRGLTVDRGERTGWVQWLGVLALGIGCFSFVSTELAPVGLLPQIGAGLGTSDGVVGLLVSGFAIVVALTASPLTAMTSKLSRRTLMITLLITATAGNVIAAIAQEYWQLLIARILVALAIGVFWSTASGVAVRLVPAHHAVRATSVVIGGLALAQVAGVPLATWLGQHAGWHAAFIALSIVSFVALIVAASVIPPLPSTQTGGASELVRSLRSAPIRTAAIVTALVMTGTFLIFTYITPFLQSVAGLDEAGVTTLLVVYGAAGVLGTFGIAPLIKKSLRGSLIGTLVVLAASLILLWGAGSVMWLTIVLLATWGASYGALPVLMQTWVFQETATNGESPEAASSLYVAAYNGAIAIGAFVGALLIDSTGVRLVALVGGLVAVVALVRAMVPAHGTAVMSRKS